MPQTAKMNSNHFRHFNFKDCFGLPKRRCDECDMCRQKILVSEQHIPDANDAEEIRREKRLKPSLDKIKKKKVSIEQHVTPCLTPKLLQSSSCLADRALDFAKAIGPIVMNNAEENRSYSVSIIKKKSVELTETNLSGKSNGIDFDNVTVNVSLEPSHVVIPFDTGFREETSKSVEFRNLVSNTAGMKNAIISNVYPNSTTKLSVYTNSPNQSASVHSNTQHISKNDDILSEDSHLMRKDMNVTNRVTQEGNSFTNQQCLSSETLREHSCYDCKHQRSKNRNTKKSMKENFVNNASHNIVHQIQDTEPKELNRDNEGSSEPSSVESPKRSFEGQTKFKINKRRKRDSISTELKESIAQDWAKHDEKNIALKVYTMTDIEKKKFTEDICSKVEEAITSKFETVHAKHLSELKGVESALAANAKKLNSVLKRLIEIENKMNAGGSILRLEDKQSDKDPIPSAAKVDFDRVECTSYADSGVAKRIAVERADAVSKTSVLYQQRPEKLIKNIGLKETCKVVEASNDLNEDDVCAESLDSSSNSLSGLVASNSLSLKQGTRQCWNPAK